MTGNQLDLEESWVRDVVEQQSYPLTKTELASVLREEIDPELQDGCWIRDELELDRERYGSVEAAWDAVEKNFKFEVSLPDWPDGVGPDD